MTKATRIGVAAGGAAILLIVLPFAARLPGWALIAAGTVSVLAIWSALPEWDRLPPPDPETKIDHRDPPIMTMTRLPEDDK